MKRVVSIGLLVLLIYHTLGYVLACVTIWWQAQHDLTERLVVYRATDSLVEFQIPLIDKGQDAHALTKTTAQGFAYRGHFYEVVNLQIRNDTLIILGVDFRRNSWWQADLLSFLNDRIGDTTNAQKKAGQLLKLLLKEYSPNPRTVFQFLPQGQPRTCPLAGAAARLFLRALPVHSPPPQA